MNARSAFWVGSGAQRARQPEPAIFVAETYARHLEAFLGANCELHHILLNSLIHHAVIGVEPTDHYEISSNGHECAAWVALN